MDFLNDIDEETLLVIPNNIKTKVLKEIEKINHLVNIKIVTIDELKKDVLFDYGLDALLYLMNKYDYKIEVSKIYIENMYYIDKEKYDSPKLNKLALLKRELLDKGLITKRNILLDYYFNKKVIVFGYDYINKLNLRVFNKFNNLKIVKRDYIKLEKEVYELETLDDEVKFVFDKIMNLIENGVDVTKINIVCQNEYFNTIKKYSIFYKLPINIDLSFTLNTTIMFKDSYNYLLNSKSFIDTVEFIKNKYDVEREPFKNIYKTIVNLFNKFNTLDYPFEKILECITYYSQNIKIDNNVIDKGINITSLKDNIFDIDEHVFIMGFNQGVLPVIHKDEEFISDSLKKEVDIELVKDLNGIEKESLLSKIYSIKNLTMTYKRKNKEEEFYPSVVILENFKIVKGEIDYSRSYSKVESSIYLASLIDDLIKYDNKNDKLSLYYSTFEIPYRSYLNNYKGINIESLKEYLDKKLVLSYSTIDSYFKCEFKYYIENILKLNKYEETFNTFIGSLFHFVLSRVYTDNFDMERDYAYFIKDRTFTPKEMFYIEKLKKELKIICDRLKDFNNITGLTNVFTEKKITIDKSSDIEVIFKGIVDKIMYKEYDGKNLVSIIDYKTGYTEVDAGDIYYGLGMQLFIYLYLITKSNLFENLEFVGFYLQRILDKEVNIENNKTYLEQKYKNLRLYGYSIDDTYLLEKFDTTYENSEYIAGMKYGKNGFYKYTKVLSKDKMEKIVSIIDEKIDNARDNILKANFNINPKKFIGDKEIVGCKFCKYRDLCFRKNEDIVNISKIKDLKFLDKGGEE